MRDRLPLRILSGLIRLYPASTRSDDRADMLATSRARRSAMGPVSSIRLLRFWTREYLGMVRGAVIAHRDHRPQARPRAAATQFDKLARDVRMAVRGWLRRPSLFVTSVIVLSVGIGANGAMAGVGWSVLFGPMAIPDADRLLRLFHDDDLTFGVSLNELLGYREAGQSFDDLAGWMVASSTYQSPDGPVRLISARVTPNFFAVLGRGPALGRSFSPQGELAEIVLSHRFWSRFGGADSTVIGTRAEFDGVSYEIVGVLPADLVFPDPSIDIFHPIDLTQPRPPGRGGQFVDVIARLSQDVTLKTAGAEVDRLARMFRDADPRAYEAEPDFGAHVVPLRAILVDGHRALLAAMIIGAGLVLLTTCINVTTLLLSGIESRSADLVVRRALGASTGDLMRIHVAEGVVLAGVSAGSGGFVAHWATGLLSTTVPVELVAGTAGASGQVVVAVVLATLVAAGVFAMTPVPVVVRAGRVSSSRHSTARSSPVSLAIRTAQTSVALILMNGALLLYASVRNQAAVDLGYRVDGVVTARITLPPYRYASDDQTRDFFNRLSAQLERAPGVRAVGLVSSLPLSGLGGSGDVYIESIDPDSAVDVVAHRLASPGYFPALGISMLAGRNFADTDRTGAIRVVVVDEAFAARFFGSPAAAVGQRVRSFFGGADWNEIVGVVASVSHAGPRATRSPHAYYPIAQRPSRGLHVVVHAAADPGSVLQIVRGAVSNLDPTLPVYDVATMSDRLRTTMATSRFTLVLFGGFALVAVGLALVGIYGTVRLAQERRVREIGIRRALGAPMGEVIWVVTRGVFATVGLGVLVGAAGALGMGVVLESLLFGVTGSDPIVLALAIALTALVGSSAAVVPATDCVRGEVGPMLTSD